MEAVPDLNTGTIFAIFNCEGTVPAVSEREMTWCNGFNNSYEKFLRKNMEMPLRSRDFLDSRRLIASIISFSLTGISVKLKKEEGLTLAGLSKNSTSVGTISSIIKPGAVVIHSVG